MVPEPDAVYASPARPDRADVVVIGGGIVGASTALALAERGLSVVLCEKGRIAGEQSGRNWGWVRTMGRDRAELPLAIESRRLWAGMNERVGAETGYRRTGIVYLCRGRAETERRAAWLTHARDYQLETRMLGPEEVASVVPGAARRWDGALHTPGDGRAEPQKAAPAIARAAMRAGATVLTGCAVRGVETAAGRLAAVVTEHGPIRCDAAVLAAGAWSRLFSGNLGIRLPQLTVVSSVMRTAPLEGLPEVAVAGDRFAFRKRSDGGYTIAQPGANIAPVVPDTFRQFFQFLPAMRGQWRLLRVRVGRQFVTEWRMPRRWALDGRSPFEDVRVLDPAPNAAILDAARRALVREIPGFAPMQVVDRWAGAIDATPDSLPVIAPVDAVPGFFVASGFSGHGFGIGPGAGALMADLVTGSPPVVDPTPFRFERFERANPRSPRSAV